jgi:hypothetical protein
MIKNDEKTSLLIPSQLPGFIRDNNDYANFIAFIQAYYEFLESANTSNTTSTTANSYNQGITFASKNLPAYSDINNTLDDFLKYYINDFLPYFPEEALLDKRKAIKYAKQLYQTKGTPASYQFLFRVLYNSDFDFYNTGDRVLKASAGSWYVSRSLKLATDDPRFLSIQNYRLLGETTKSFATIENSVLAQNKTEVFISNIERLFNSGETVRVVDNQNQDVIINGSNLRAKVVGQLSQINVYKDQYGNTYRGLFYNPGDPVVIYGGLNPTLANPIGATAQVGSVTSGSIQQINVVYGGRGYTPYSPTSNNSTAIEFTNLNSGAAAPIAIVGGVDTSNVAIANFIVLDSIASANNVKIANSFYFLISGTNLTVSANNYAANNIVFQGPSLASNTFSARVRSLDSTNNIVYISNTTGNIIVSTPLFCSNDFTINSNVVSYNSLSNGITFTANTFTVGETIYQGANLAYATFTASVVRVSNNVITIDNVAPLTSQTVIVNANVVGTNSSTRRIAKSQFTSNANTSLANSFTYASFPTYPISSVYVQNGGGGITTPPTVVANSYYATTNPAIIGHLSALGILAPLQIENPGKNYSVGDKITITGGRGIGAQANIISVNSSGAIMNVAYVQVPDGNNIIRYPYGGWGYTPDSIPTVNVVTSTGSNASLYVPGVLGAGAQFSLTVDRAGSVSTINLLTYGEDYDAQPNVSLKVQDIVITNANPLNLPLNLQTAYQGSSLSTASYIATVAAVSSLQNFANTSQNLYNLRLFNYNALPNSTLPIKISNTSISVSIVNSNYAANNFFNGSPTYTNGVKTYGDGNAKATAKFLNGLTIGQGQYLDSQGQPSAFNVLQSSYYNNFTYEITVQKEISRYRDILLNLLHPAGMQLIGRYSIRSNNNFNTSNTRSFNSADTLAYYTGTVNSQASMQADFTNAGNNIVRFINLSGANIATFIVPGYTISLNPPNGPPVFSTVQTVDYANSKVILTNNIWLTYANVAYVSANSGSSVINIRSLTGSYNIMNNGVYTNPALPLKDIVFTGDTVKLGTSTYTVTGVNASAGTISVSSTISTTTANSLLSVNRTYNVGGTLQTYNQVRIYGPLGQGYVPEITDELGNSLTTQLGQVIILG